MKKICVIFTGGTIGSCARGQTVSLRHDEKSILIQKYRERFDTEVEFDELQPLNILSENIQFSDLEKMADSVRSVNKRDYDGIIVTHGTDTLTFTANLFSQIFKDIEIPLVLVSALFPLDDSRSNGLDNFAGAVDFISEADFGGVFVAFRNEGENCKIHLASRLTFAEQISGNFQSVLGVAFAEFIDGKLAFVENKINPSVGEIKEKRLPYGKYEICKDIVTIRARSFLDFSLYNFGDRRPKAVIIELYHSGTVCTAGEETNVFNFIDYCKNLGVQVVLSPIDSGARVYSSAEGLRGKCIFACDISLEMTAVKVMLALGSGKSIAEELESNNFFEKLA